MWHRQQLVTPEVSDFSVDCFGEAICPNNHEELDRAGEVCNLTLSADPVSAATDIAGEIGNPFDTGGPTLAPVRVYRSE